MLSTWLLFQHETLPVLLFCYSHRFKLSVYIGVCAVVCSTVIVLNCNINKVEVRRKRCFIEYILDWGVFLTTYYNICLTTNYTMTTFDDMLYYDIFLTAYAVAYDGWWIPWGWQRTTHQYIVLTVPLWAALLPSQVFWFEATNNRSKSVWQAAEHHAEWSKPS